MKKEDKNFIQRVFERTMSALKGLWRWTKRGVFGGKKELFEMGEEEVESPAKLIRQAFFRKKTAVAALVILLSLFLFVFIYPALPPESALRLLPWKQVRPA